MNALWQRLLGRVLSEWAPGVTVREEFTLRHLFQSDPAFTPRPRRLRNPRPDFAVLLPGKPVRYLDAKYRDLWTQGLPRDMLYQLALYASAQAGGAAAMLYPTEAVEAAEERLDVCNLIDGRPAASVALRRVHLQRLVELVAEPVSTRREAERQAFAWRLLGVRVEPL
jgi:5-methylcytosine-specific restriction enzyme subunit McrC